MEHSFSLRDKKLIDDIKMGKQKISKDITSRYEDLAMEYIDQGYSVTPVVFKRPYLLKWQSFVEEEVFTPDWYKGANGLGVICGEINNLVCLDIDIEDTTDHIRLELLKKLPRDIYAGKVGNPDRLPSRYYRYNGEIAEKFTAIGVEILSTGNQTVLPGSLHDKYDKKYEVVGKSLLEIDTDDLPDLPSDIIPWLRFKNEEAKQKKREVINSKTGEVSLISINDYKLTPEAGRCCHNSYNVLSMLAVSLCKEGHGFEYVTAACLKRDDHINKNSDYKMFECLTRVEFRGYNKTEACDYFVSQVFNKHVIDQTNVRTILNEKQYRYFRPKIETGFTEQVVVGKDLSGKDKLKSVRQHLVLYRYLKALHHAEYLPIAKSFAIWNGKHFELKGEDFIKMFAQKNFKNPEVVSIGDRNTFLELVKNKLQGNINDYILKDTSKINLSNGVYDLKTKRLSKHNRDFKMSNIIDVPFVNNTDCPVWNKLLDVITLSRPHMKLAIEEYIGYIICATSYDQFNKLLILDGGGSNGKSTLIRIIKNLLGENNCSAVDITTIGNERFSAFGLFNKLVNFCSEVPKEAFKETGSLKKITGGDPINVEEKHKGAFITNILAKFIISYNKMPFFPDNSDGMRRRVMLIPCEQNFESSPDIKIKDVELKVALERPAILFKCITAFQAVQERGDFTSIPEGMERFDEMVKSSNSYHEFFDEYLSFNVENPSKVLSSDILYSNYLDYQGNKTLVTKRRFISELIDVANRESLKNHAGKFIVQRARTNSFRGVLGLIYKSAVDSSLLSPKCHS